MKFRLRLKDSVKKLKGARQEEYFDNLRALHRIEPFKHLYAYVILLIIFLFLGYYRASGILILLYISWCVLYLIVFTGVRYMYKDSLKEQEIEDVLREKV